MAPPFAELLRGYLRRSALPLRQAARRARLPHQTLFNWARGARPRWHPGLPDEIGRLGLALGLSDGEVQRLLEPAGCLPARAMSPHTHEGAMRSDTERTAGLPKGWLVAGSRPSAYEASVEPAAHDGAPAAFLRARDRGAAGEGFGTLMQTFGAGRFRGRRLRLSALVRARDVERWAGLWMRVDGRDRRSLAFDNMQRRPIAGTADWSRHEVVLDVPEEAEAIALGVLLNGAGELWLAGVRVEPVGPDVPTTDRPPLPDGPVNLDFTER